MDAGAIHHAEASIDFSTLLLNTKLLVCWTTKRPVWLEREIVAREATSLPCGTHLRRSRARGRGGVRWRRRESRSTLGRAYRIRMKLMAQFQAEVPDPLGHALPGFLPPGRVAAPSIRINLLIFIRERRLEGTAMQGQLDHIAGSEGMVREVREEPFVDNPCACDPDRTLLFSCGMRGHNHAAERSLGSHRDLGAVVEGARHLTDRGRCWT